MIGIPPLSFCWFNRLFHVISIKHVDNTIEAVKQNFKVTFCQITETFEPFYIHAMYNCHCLSDMSTNLLLSYSGSVDAEQTSFSSKLIKSDLHDFFINPLSWNKAVGICPIGQTKTFSTVTSSRTFARAKALLKTISGFIWALITSSDRHLRLQRFVRSSIWTWKWVNKNS